MYFSTFQHWIEMLTKTWWLVMVYWFWEQLSMLLLCSQRVTSAQVKFHLFAQIWTSVRLVPSDVTHALFAKTFLDHTAAGVDLVTLATARLPVKVSHLIWNVICFLAFSRWVSKADEAAGCQQLTRNGIFLASLNVSDFWAILQTS